MHGGATGAGAGAVVTTVVGGGVLAAAATVPATMAPATKPAAASPLSQLFEQLLHPPLPPWRTSHQDPALSGPSEQSFR